ncbi:glycosyltransferase, MGT family [Mycobacterium basiliense]|uniref:Glycosyltransferase, MGT family n=1 Tax=Mycobacterium basiliense TaxID=2094119 RepID=A0A447G7W0_9MYCO|nr:glycosyltransferase [Mycobacterium basiliense]VDM86594.1 glycosyltransferase, MGT family [Mycobacterium basiliense]
MKIVVASYGSRGDVEPGAAVARELLRRGHDVRMAVPPNMLDFVESAGLAAVSYGPDARERMNPAQDLVRDLATKLHNPIGILSEVTEHVSRVTADKSAALTSLAHGVDLLLASFNEQGLAANVAEYHGIPLAALHFFPKRIWASGQLAPLVTREAEHAQRRLLGLPETSESALQRRAQRGWLEIQAYDEFCLPGPTAQWVEPDGLRPFVGALTLELPTEDDAEVLSWIAAGTPPIYFGFGSTPITSWAETVTMIGTVCAELGERALICSGANDFSDVLPPEGVKVVRAVNHAAIFPACRAVVHHGGAGTTAAGMRAGIPTLILWLWLDQPIWAAAVERLQVGLGRPFWAATSQSLLDDLRAILAPQCSARATEVAARMSTSADSVVRAADLLEDAARLDSVD